MSRTRQSISGFAFVAVVFGWPFARDTNADSPDQPAQFRQPAAVVATEGFLYVANRRSGSVSVVDTRSREVVGEVAIGQRLVDIVDLRDGRTLLTVDESRHELTVVNRDRGELKVVERIPVAHSPVSAVVSDNGRRVSVASLWSRRVTLFSVQRPSDSEVAKLTIDAVIDLPFAPRKQWISADGQRVVVADAFGGSFGVIDVSQEKLVAVRTIEGHNLGGIAASHDGRELLVTHQMLNGRVPTVRESIFWGTVLGNIVKSIELAEMFNVSTPTPETKSFGDGVPSQPIAHWSLVPLGRPGDAAGDPGEIAVSSHGATIVTLGGVNQVSIRTSPRQPMSRREVGRRPIDVAFSPDENLAYVANMFDDTISVIDIDDMTVIATIPLGPLPELTLADRGERLFHDARLSLDGWYSCHSCHTEGHTCDLLNDNFGDDSTGAPKRIPSLLGVGETGPWAWNGKQDELKSQLQKSIKLTMRGEGPDVDAVNLDALAAYLKTLAAPPSINAARGIDHQQMVTRGRVVFKETGCADCHREPAYTSPRTYDVGLADETGAKEFNPPSLLGVSQRTGYLHDNRAQRLEDVFQKHKHQGGGELSDDDLEALVSYLRSL